MTGTTFSDHGVRVIDGVLSTENFLNIQQEVAQGEFKSVHTQRWDKSWRLWDGHPMRGTSVYYDPTQRFDWSGARYPTRSAVDLLIDAIRQATFDNPEIVGREGGDWDALYLSPWLYPVGSALSDHFDADRYAGSFTYFVHSRWSGAWGGELLVAMPGEGIQPPTVDTPGRHPWITGDDHHETCGLAIAITPKPNRLVLLSSDRLHRVARVDSNAGDHVRTSIAGFFLRTEL
jgi:hypothetical protein